jgi:phage terminase large subunit-like protein
MALKSGAKSQVKAGLPPVSDGIVKWLEARTGDSLYEWQARELEILYGEGRPRVGYVQVARKNGKTRLAALLALAEACTKEQRHVYAVSDSERNLNSTLMRELRDLVFGSPELEAAVHVFQTKFEVPSTGSFIETRPNNFQASQGINPHLVLFDEVHLQKNADTWSGMQMAGAARPDALLLGITTPGYDLTSLAHSLYEQVRAGTPGLYGRIFEADPAADIDDEVAWRQANPCFDRPGFAEAMRFDRGILPEHEFRRFRLGQWTATDQAWLPYGAWAACAAAGADRPPPGTRIYLGFDGSYSGDSTALVGVTDELHVFVVGCWENPGRAGWRVPRAQVVETVAEAFDTWKVMEMHCDPPYWGGEIAEWSARWRNKVVEFPTYSRARMAPACTTFYSAVMEGTLSHDGDPRLARHVSNAVVKSSPLGDYVTKADRDSPAKIDLAVAAIIAYQAAASNRKPARKPLAVL